MNPGLCSERLVANHLYHGTALIFNLICPRYRG
jgi:hypothetical protein